MHASQNDDPGQLASLEQRARELVKLADELERQARDCPTEDWRPNAFENARTLRAITAALSAQFTDNGADAECACTGQVVRDGVTYCSDCGRTLSAQPRGVDVPDDGSDPGEFGCGIQPNPKARYWQGRADFWRGQAVALGYKPSGEDEAAPQPREEMSPDFTDSARAAIAWVLYHHQGGSSPVGQPLRFALGMGAHEDLPDWRIAEAKQWAESTGSTTREFHAPQPRAVRGVEYDREAIFQRADVRVKLYSLMQLVEGPGCERWANPGGFRLKDTSQWVEFYCLVKDMQRNFATTPQDAAGVDTAVTIEQLSNNAPLQHSERADAEQAYTLTAFDYVRAPVGTHDWQLYWRGWWHRSQLYTTHPPGVDVGKLRELESGWRQQAVNARAYAKRLETGEGCSEERRILADQSFNRADTFDEFANELALAIDAAAPGVQS